MGKAFAPARILAFESEDERPTVKQAEKLASIYGRSPILLYLPEPPEEPELPADYRLSRTNKEEAISPRLRKLVRRLEDLRATALDLAEELDETEERFPAIPLKATLQKDPEHLVEAVRGWLDIKIDQQRSWRKSLSAAFARWRTAFEHRGILVYVELGAHSVAEEEVRGFCLARDVAPLIAVNNSDARSAQIFTLFHELGHLLLRESALSLDMEREDPGQDQASRVEAWCNRFAGAVLVPQEALRAHTLTGYVTDAIRSDPKRPDDSCDARLQSMAADFAVSPEVIVRRLAIMNAITTGHYRMWRTAWYERHPYQPPPRRKATGGPSPAQLAPTRYGMGFLSLLYSAYWSDAVSAMEVGDLIGGKLKTVKQLEQTVRHRLSEAVV